MLGWHEAASRGAGDWLARPRPRGDDYAGIANVGEGVARVSGRGVQTELGANELLDALRAGDP